MYDTTTDSIVFKLLLDENSVRHIILKLWNFFSIFKSYGTSNYVEVIYKILLKFSTGNLSFLCDYN